MSLWMRLAGQQPEQAHSGPRVDRSPVLSGQTGRVDVRDRRLDRVGGSQRHVGAQEHVSRAEELENAAHRVWRAEERRVDVGPAEVVERRPRKTVPYPPKTGTHRATGGKGGQQDPT